MNYQELKKLKKNQKCKTGSRGLMPKLCCVPYALTAVVVLLCASLINNVFMLRARGGSESLCGSAYLIIKTPRYNHCPSASTPLLATTSESLSYTPTPITSRLPSSCSVSGPSSIAPEGPALSISTLTMRGNPIEMAWACSSDGS